MAAIGVFNRHSIEEMGGNMLKKFVLILTILLLVVGCSNGNSSKQLVGKWAQSDTKGATISFYDDGTLQFEIVWAIIKGTYTVDGNKVAAKLKGGDKDMPVDMELIDGKLHIEGEKAPFIKQKD
jgi:hypothetical protein